MSIQIRIRSFPHSYLDSVPLYINISHGLKHYSRGFPGGAVVESLPADAGDTGSSPGLGGSHMPRSN